MVLEVSTIILVKSNIFQKYLFLIFYKLKNYYEMMFYKKKKKKKKKKNKEKVLKNYELIV